MSGSAATRRTSQLRFVAAVAVSNVDKLSNEGEVPVQLCNYVDVFAAGDIDSTRDYMRATATPAEVHRFSLLPGDTVLTKDSETASDIGASAYVTDDAPELVCAYHLAVVRPERRCLVPRFLFWATKSDSVRDQWRTAATGVTRFGVRQADLLRVEVPVPPLEEQRAIADYLDRETARIDDLIDKQERLIELLRERRSAAVWSGVTGRGEPGDGEQRIRGSGRSRMTGGKAGAGSC